MTIEKKNELNKVLIRISHLDYFHATVLNVFNPNLGGLFRGSFWGVGVKTTPCLKIVRVMLETWNLVWKYTHMVSENITFSTKIPLILLMSGFLLQKNQHFFLAKIVLKAIVWKLFSRFSSSVFSLCKIKSHY